MTRSKIVIALKGIKSRHPKRKLMPKAVVDAARDPKSPLHNKFQWDDTKAAHDYRLWQARQLIAEVEIYLDEKTERSGPAYVSLVGDRNTGGGYRAIEDVLSSKRLRNELIETAIFELKLITERHNRLIELAGIRCEIELLEQQVKRKSHIAA